MFFLVIGIFVIFLWVAKIQNSWIANKWRANHFIYLPNSLYDDVSISTNTLTWSKYAFIFSISISSLLYISQYVFLFYTSGMSIKVEPFNQNLSIAINKHSVVFNCSVFPVMLSPINSQMLTPLKNRLMKSMVRE